MFRPINSSGLWQAWPTPVFRAFVLDHERINSFLKPWLFARSSSELGQNAANVGSWQSFPDFFTRADNEMAGALHAAIAEGVRLLNRNIGVEHSDECPLEGWAVVARSADHLYPHIHHESMWSGVYYVQTTEQPGADRGAIEFLDPRWSVPPTSPETDQTLCIQPDEGLMVIFPSWLAHWVRPHNATQLRSCVAFNIYGPRPGL